MQSCLRTAQDAYEKLSPFRVSRKVVEGEQAWTPQQLRDRYSEFERQANLATAKTAKLRREAKSLRESTLGSIQRIQGFAYQDRLTGLANRHLLDEFLESCCQSRSEGVEVLVMLVDVDRFQVINEVLGVEAGNLLLGEIAERLSLLAPPGGAFGRRDGDEFMLVVGEVPHDQLERQFDRLATRIKEELARPFEVKGQTFEMTASIGASSYPKFSLTAGELVNQAESALSHVKTQGRAQAVLYTENLCAQLRQSALLDFQMSPSMRDQEFQVEYQPVFRVLPEGRQDIVGVSCALKWHHRVHGVLSEEQFASIAERNGMVVSLGYRALEMVCESLLLWKSRGHSELFASLRVAGRQLLESEFAARVEEIVRNSGLSTNQIVFSVAESPATLKEENIYRSLLKLHEVGFLLGLEEFGDRHFSLAHLSRVNFFRLSTEILQTDQSFYRRLVKVVSNLGGHAIAVGVDSEEKQEFVKESGCRLMEGEYFSRPMTASEFTTRYLNRLE